MIADFCVLRCCSAARYEAIPLDRRRQQPDCVGDSSPAALADRSRSDSIKLDLRLPELDLLVASAHQPLDPLERALDERRCELDATVRAAGRRSR